MLRKAMAFAAATMLASCVAYAQQYDELPFVPGEPPPQAEIGQAWCIFVYPATYKTVTEQVLVRPATTKMTPVPATYGRETQNFVCEPEYTVGTVSQAVTAPRDIEVVCVPEHKVLKVVPPQFQQKQIEVEVCPPYEEEYWVPTTFRNEPKSFTITPERKELRKVACVDGTTIDCYTVVGAAAKIETVQIKVVDQPGRIERRLIPAKKQTVTVNELVAPARVEEVVVPAQKQMVRGGVVTGGKVTVQTVAAKVGTVTSMTVVKEASITQEPVEAVYQTQTRQVLDQPERVVWRKQMLTQPLAYSAPVAPAPVADAAAEQVFQDYGSVPGTAAVRQRYLYK